MAVYRVQDTSLTAVADAIRAKAGTSDALTFPDGFVEAVGGIQAGGGGAAGVSPKEVNFYDYDGTLLHAYTVAEARRMAELPAGPTHKGLVFQGWNWSLGAVRSLTRAMNIGAMYITDDGTTRLYITLTEGRTSPMLGVGVNGTVTVDWGDGTEPDVLTGTSVSTTVWTPNHAYAKPGDYVIRLTVDGEMAFSGSSSKANVLRQMASSDNRNAAYLYSLYKVEIGEKVQLRDYAFAYCAGLQTVSIPNTVSSLALYSFQYCRSLNAVVIPYGVTKLNGYEFSNNERMRIVSMPDSLNSMWSGHFSNCYIMDSVTIPDSVKSASSSLINYCVLIKRFDLPAGLTEVSSNAATYCDRLAVVTIPPNVSKIASNAFRYNYSMAYYDFTSHTAVPTLVAATAFDGIPADCEIRVPAALYDEWIAATNWATYASQIKAY